jgi:hypothetical protein
MHKFFRTVAIGAIAAMAAAPLVVGTSAQASMQPASSSAAHCNAEARGACATVSGITSSGTAEVGVTLTCQPHLAKSYHLYGRNGDIQYSWKRSLSGGRYQLWAKGQRLPISADMLGYDYACFVTIPTAINQTREGNSELIGIVQGSFSNTVAPSVVGAYAAGVALPGHSLSARTGTWSYPSGRSFSYAWKSGNSVLSTSPRFTPTTAHLGKTVTLYVTAKRSGFTAKSVAAKPFVVRGLLANSARPGISKGSCNTATNKCTAVTGSLGKWTAGSTLKFAWLLDGKVIPKATSLTYTPAISSMGHSLQLRVTGSKANYVSQTATSKFYVVGVTSQQQ